MYVIILPLLSIYLIGTEKIKYFSIFSPKESNWPPDSFARSSITKWQSYVEPLWNTTEISFGILHLKLQILWAAPLYFPI